MQSLADSKRKLRSRVLANGRLTTIVRSDGSGATLFGAAAITPFQALATRQQEGVVFFFCDLDSGERWSSSAAWSSIEEPEAAFEWQPGEVCLRWQRHELTICMRVLVDAQRPIEMRVLKLTNTTSRRRRIQVTSYLEPVLFDPAAHASHPEFSKLFVQTEWLPQWQALLARRRPRVRGTVHPVAAHLLLDSPAVEWESDRARFVGRSVGVRWPLAMNDGAVLSASTGDILDPILSLRTVLTLKPQATQSLSSALVAGADRAEALALCEELREVGDVSTWLDAARRRAETRLHGLELELSQAQALQELAAGILQGDRRLAANADLLRRAGGSLEELERFGYSAWRRLAVVHVGGDDDPRRDAAQRAHNYWRSLGLPIDVLLLCDSEPIRERSEPSGPREVATSSLSAANFDLLHAAAYLVVQDEWPRLSASTKAANRNGHELGSSLQLALRPDPSPTAWPQPIDPAEALVFFNGIGGFAASGHEYVLRLDFGANECKLPPRPWINVVGHESFGFLISETGAGSTWSLNSRERRLSPWFNDPLRDPHVEALFVRDEDSGEFWSPLPGPAPCAAAYEVRHGFGYSRFRVESHGLLQECLVFAPHGDAVKVTALRLRNTTARTRRFSLYAYQQLVLGTGIADEARFLVTTCDGETDTLFARNPVDEGLGSRCAFAAAIATKHATARYVTADQAVFVGEPGDIARPHALTIEQLDNCVGLCLRPCFAQQVVLELPAGEVAEVDFLFGEESSQAAAEQLLERLETPGAIEAGFADLREFWNEIATRVEISTPSAALDRMVNGWLPYQILSCRLWGRSALYQSGGAFGFRDQLQDAAALLLTWPQFTRQQIVLHAAHQFPEGDVLHWWHPPHDRGIRTRFADDLLWLPRIVSEYIGATGDHALLDEQVGFVTGSELPDGVDEQFFAAVPSGESADIYEHCCRALDRSLAVGSHGLPLFGCGDWNDGMNRVGRAGQGESVWMAQFLFATLGDFLPHCERRGDNARIARYSAHRQAMQAAIDAAWDGAWYRRGYYDDGQPLGSAESDECQIDALSQAWAVLCKSATPERAQRALASVEQRLIAPADGIIRLLTPPFDAGSHDPGYIKGYVPGVRENGGQYTHAALWVVQALAELRRHDRVAALLEMLTPIAHTRTPDGVERYRLEPYVLAGDVYGVAPHVGRGGWSWYTGAAGWMVRVALESLLGLRLVGGEQLLLRPCVPHDWPQFAMRVRVGGAKTVYEFDVRNPSRNATAIQSATLDGTSLRVDGEQTRIPLLHDGQLHRVQVVLGAAKVGA